MKLGRYIPLDDYGDVKIGYGTIDHKNLKTSKGQNLLTRVNS